MEDNKRKLKLVLPEYFGVNSPITNFTRLYRICRYSNINTNCVESDSTYQNNDILWHINRCTTLTYEQLFANHDRSTSGNRNPRIWTVRVRRRTNKSLFDRQCDVLTRNREMVIYASSERTDKHISHNVSKHTFCRAPDEVSKQPTPPIRVFAIRMRKFCILGYPKCTQ